MSNIGIRICNYTIQEPCLIRPRNCEIWIKVASVEPFIFHSRMNKKEITGKKKWESQLVTYQLANIVLIAKL